MSGEKNITYFYYLSTEMVDRLRVSALKKKKKILGFTVQYEAKINNKWQPIVRYDTAHGFAHKDIIHSDGKTEKQPLYFQSFNIALTFAIQDLKILWKWYRESYEKEVKK